MNNRILRSACYGGVLVFLGIFMSPLARADEAVEHPTTPSIRLEEANLPTKLIQKFYPAIPFYTAKVFLDFQGWKDSGTNKFVGYIILASAFHAAENVPRVLSDLNIAASSATSEALTSFAMFIPAWLVNPGQPGLATNFLAAGTNQLGVGFKKAISDNPELLNQLVTRFNSTGHNIEHISEVMKSTTAAMTLSTIGFFKGGHDLASFSDKVAASGSFTSAYVLRGALIEHFKHAGYQMPEINTAALLSFVGALGTIMTNPGQMPAIVSEALLEAGFYTGVTKAVDSVKLEEKRSITYLIAALGALLHTSTVPGGPAMSPYMRIRNTLASALLLPAAFTTLDIVKEHFARLSYN